MADPVLDDAAILAAVLRDGSCELNYMLRQNVTLGLLRGNPALRDVVDADITRIIAALEADGHETITLEDIERHGWRRDVAELFAAKRAAAHPRSAARFNVAIAVFLTMTPLAAVLGLAVLDLLP